MIIDRVLAMEERADTVRVNIRRYRRAQEIMRQYPALPCARCGAGVAAEPIATEGGAIVFQPIRCPCGHLTKIHLLKRDWNMKKADTLNTAPIRYWWEPWPPSSKSQ